MFQDKTEKFIQIIKGERTMLDGSMYSYNFRGDFKEVFLKLTKKPTEYVKITDSIELIFNNDALVEDNGANYKVKVLDLILKGDAIIVGFDEKTSRNRGLTEEEIDNMLNLLENNSLLINNEIKKYERINCRIAERGQTMKIILKKPGNSTLEILEVKEEELSNKMRELVDGPLEYTELRDGIDLISNEEFLFGDYEYNFHLSDIDTIYKGNVIFAGVNYQTGKTIGLTDEQISKVEDMFKTNSVVIITSKYDTSNKTIVPSIKVE